jgi:quinol-cytochrome oxidoreductase complex cytochrome b subunit
MNRAEKEEYLREYAQLKAKGKPFFPYAVAKDSLMACFVLLAIILMSLMFGAELGPTCRGRSGTSSSSSSCCG